MPVPTFVRAGAQSPLWFLQLTAPPPGITGYSVAFLPDLGPAPPDTLTLEATWSTSPGIYLFLGELVADQAALAAAVRDYTGTTAVRFLWIANPNDVPANWDANAMLVTAGALAQPAQIAFRNYVLFVAGGTTIALDGNADAFNLTAPPNGLALITGSGAYTLTGNTAASIPFDGDAVGCVQFSLPVSDAGGGVPAFAQLDACCRYFVDAAWPDAGELTSLRYPVLALTNGPITLWASLDPVNPLAETRTAFDFLETPATPGTAIASAFADAYGSAVTLTPVVSTVRAAGPALVFAVNPTTTTPAPGDPFYLTFAGSFTLTIPTSSSGGAITARLMCGFSGVEYAGFAGGTGNTIHFFAGQPAYAPSFRTPATALNAPVPLDPAATTAWAYVTPASGTAGEYFAQPQESVLYEAAQTGNFLSYLEVFAGTFPTTIVPPAPGVAGATAIPMVPYAYVDPASLADVRALELTVLSPYRRNLLAGILAPTETGPQTGAVAAATPQGLLLGLDQELRYWETLTIARNLGGAELLQVQNVVGGFKAALQSNQLFAVVSNRDEFMRCCTVGTSFGLTIEGWHFDFSPTAWGTNETIVLLKYASTSIDELARDTAAWGWPAAADGWSDAAGDGDVATTQAALLAIIDQAKNQTGDLRTFYDRVLANAEWSGILFLRVALSAASFPPELQGLAAGFAAGPPFAHHVGATATPVVNSGGTLAQLDSSLFGLIDYRDPADLFYGNADYAYKVLALTVLFRNSAVASFSSQIELMVNKLFGDFSTLQDSVRSNNLVLNGYYQHQNGAAAYVFVDEGAHRFALDRSVLKQVEIGRAQFVTLASQQNGTVRTQFILAGTMQFEPLPGFDAYSFGPPAGTVGSEGLRFANLLVHMDFPAATPADTTFAFDANAMSFDLSSSSARTTSLYAHFPLAFRGLMVGTPDETPAELGYASVRPSQSTMAYPWYALVFGLQLGTLGALASDIGLEVMLIAAWTPSKGVRRTFIGLKLPGTSSSRPEISIEGVLKLGFSALAFTSSGATGSEYILRFKNMQLRLLTLSFPPGSNEIAVFGDPSGGGSAALGWYMAYAKDDEESPPPPDALALHRRFVALPGAPHAE